MSVIKSAAETLKDLVSGMKASGPLKGLLEPLDCQRIALNLDLSNQGRVRGLSNTPESSLSDFDNVEQQVINEITDTWTTQRQAVAQAVQQFTSLIAQVNVDAQLAQLRLAISTAKGNFTKAQTVLSSDIDRLREAAKAALLELAQFKTEHQLQRPARDDASFPKTLGLLVFLVSVESVANGFFFQEGNDLGLIGGIGIAFMISLINIALAFFIGMIPARFTNSRSSIVRTIAAITCAFCLAGMLSLHFLIAHFRDALTQGAANTTNASALASARASFWSLPTEPSSLYLFLLGSILAGLSAWKGYTCDDPYPGYGSVSRRARQAEDEYESRHQQLLNDLTDSRDTATELFESTLTNLPLEVREAASAVTQTQTLLQDLTTFETSLEQCANSLLAAYRDANSQARTTPPPAHFNDRWRLPPHAVLAFSPTILPSDDAIQTKLAEVQSLHDELIALYTSLLARAGDPELLPRSLRSRLVTP